MENALWAFVTQLPIIVVMIVGTIVLAARRSRLPGRSVLLGILGIVVTGLSVILWVVWAIASENLSGDILDSLVAVYNTVSTVINIVSAVGLLLLVLGISSAAAPAKAPTAFQPGYPPSSAGAPPQQWQYPTAGQPQPQQGWTPPPAQQPQQDWTPPAQQPQQDWTPPAQQPGWTPPAAQQPSQGWQPPQQS